MPYVLGRHKVKDWPTWKAIFDEGDALRRDAGSQGGYVWRSAEDPTEVVILLQWDTLERARQFLGGHDPGAQETMERAGILDVPDVYFLNEAGRPSA